MMFKIYFKHLKLFLQFYKYFIKLCLEHIYKYITYTHIFILFLDFNLIQINQYYIVI